MSNAPFTITVQSLPKDEGGWAIEAEVAFRDENPESEVLHLAHLALDAAIEAEAARRKAFSTARD
jgi:hypothetical protein